VVLLLMASCKKEENKSTETESTPTAFELVKTPDFNADSAFYFVKKQVDFGTRVPNTAPHEKCASYFVKTFKAYNWSVIEQKFTAEAHDKTKLKLNNIVASYNPNASKRILLMAHWDTRPYADQEQDPKLHHRPIDGANDGGSGVGVLLELARVINQSALKPTVGIDILLFDGEDYGAPSFADHDENSSKTWCLGSQYWSSNKHVAGYQAYYGILLDMVGSKNAKFAMDGTTKEYAPVIQRNIWEVAKGLGYGNVFVDQVSEPIIDDHLYVNQIAKIPTVDIIEYEPSDGAYFSATWHTLKDNIDNIDKTSLKVVGQTLLQVVYREK
jgi:glutaminyl-peptide cyclotransferase